jgi:hypothetical protein
MILCESFNYQDVGIQIALYEASLKSNPRGFNGWQIKMVYHDSGDHLDPHPSRDDAFKPSS